MEKKIRWGVIGSGGIARRRTIPEGIIPALNSQLVSVFDINSGVNEATAKHFNVVAAKSIKDLLGSGIDAVYVASPANLHAEHVAECAKAKKHILCEKPLGMTADETGEMINICNKEGVKLGVGLMMRFLAQHQAAKKLIDEGRMGDPVYGRAQLSCWYPPIEGAWRQDPVTGGGGSLMDMGSHCIDLLEMFFGEVLKVSCFIMGNVHPYKSEDSAVVSLMFKSGALATVDTFFCIPDNSSKNVLELYGSRGSILATGTIGQGSAGKMSAFLESDDAGYDAAQARVAAEGMPVDPEPVNTYRAEIEEFSSAILENRTPANGYELGLRNQKIIDACYKSARTGKVVEIK